MAASSASSAATASASRRRRTSRAPAVTTISSDRRAALAALKLQALVRDHGISADIRPMPYPGGAALLAGGQGWVLLEDDPARGLGGAMAWADQHGVPLNVVADDATGQLARRAAAFAAPPAVWHVEGRALVPAVPDALPTAPPLPDEVRPLAAIIEAAGADPVVEHGVLTGEVAGLEVCRAVVGPESQARLEVGIGPHDREAFQLVHGDDIEGPALVEALRAVVRAVAAHRRPAAAPHPLNRLARERALRHRLVEEPAVIGLDDLRPAAPPLPRTSPKEAVPSVAVGTDGSRPVVVVCSAGVDLDFVPYAADALAAHGDPAARLLLAVPEGDDHPVTQRLAGRLARPAELVAVPGP